MSGKSHFRFGMSSDSDIRLWVSQYRVASKPICKNWVTKNGKPAISYDVGLILGIASKLGVAGEPGVNVEVTTG